MRRAKRERPEWTAQEGTASAPGAGYHPAGLPDDSAEGDQTQQAGPHGYPVNPQEYRRLKEAAAKKVRPPAPCAQEDPSARPDDDPGAPDG